MASKIKEVAASVKEKVTGHGKHVRMHSYSHQTKTLLRALPEYAVEEKCVCLSVSFYSTSHRAVPCRRRLRSTTRPRKPTRKVLRHKRMASVSLEIFLPNQPTRTFVTVFGRQMTLSAKRACFLLGIRRLSACRCRC